MSKEIEQRVVEMRFDNSQFESKVKTTMSTLDKLKQSLKFNNVEKGFEKISDSARKVDLNILTKSIETVQTKFTSLQVIGITALANITNSAVNAGKRIVSALTIDPITTGFQEYETQINAVQTILANTQSKGSTLSDVNKALDELNTYADQTIYNFTEMTKNIGTFTAAGVDLDKSVTSIKGIANLAAVSGSTSQQASTAMYQLSQALAAGKVSLMDWNSVVNAGMGGEVFQTALKRTAKQMGYNVDALIAKYGSFRESLTEGQWLTADVLTETLTQLSGAYTEADLISQGYSEKQAKEITELAETAVNAATKVKTFTQLFDTLKETAQSGWTTTWEILVGDFEEAKEFLTELSEMFGDVINGFSDSRNALLYDAMSSNWKKLTDEITEAGISVEDFKDKAIQVAKGKKIDIDSIISDYGSLEKAFKEGAISSDILSETLTKIVGTTEDLEKKMTSLKGKYKTNEDILKALTDAGYKYDELQNLTQKSTKGVEISLNDLSDEQLLSIGYTSKQIQSIRDLAKQFDLTGGSAKDFIANITVPSGRELLIDAIKTSIESLISVFSSVGKAWREVFPPMSADTLYGIVETIKEFTDSIKPSEETLNKIQRTFRGLFSILDIGKQIFVPIIEGIASLIGHFSGLGSGLLDMTAGFGDWLYNLDQVIKKTDIFGQAIDTIVYLLTLVGDAIVLAANYLKEQLSKIKVPGLEVLHEFLERINERILGISDSSGNMAKSVEKAISLMGDAISDNKFINGIVAFKDGLESIFTSIIDSIVSVTNAVLDSMGDINFNSLFDMINTASFGAITIGIVKFLKSVSEPIESFSNIFDNFSGILDGVVGILDGVQGSLEAYQTKIKAGALMMIATAVAILTASIVALSLIDSEKLTKSLGAITFLFGNLIVAMSTFGNFNIIGVLRTSLTAIALSTAILILASALKKIGDLDAGSVLSSLMGIAGLSGILVATAYALNKNSGAVISGATRMVIFAGAMNLMVTACKRLAELDWNELVKGLVGVGVLLGELSLFLNTAKFSGYSVLTATSLVILAGALKILFSVCEDFAKMNWGEITKGLASVGILLAQLAIFTKITAGSSGVISTGLGLIALAAAIKIFASAMKDISDLSWEEIAKGLVGIAGSLLSVALALNIMPKNMIATGTGLVVIASSLLIMSNAIESLGSMSWEEVIRGLTALAGSMTILAIALNAMRGTISGSAALLIAAGALGVIAPILVLLGSMSWEGIAKGLVAVAGAFAVIGVAGLLLSPLIPTLLGLGASLSLIGIGVLGVGAGLLAVGAGLSAVAVGLVALTTALVGGSTAIVAFISSLVVGIAGLIPTVLSTLAQGIVEFAKVIAAGAPVLGEAIKEIVLMAIDVLVECVPALAEGALELVVGALEALSKYTPQLVDVIFDVVIGLIDALATKLPELTESLVNLFVSLFSGVIDALTKLDTSVLLKTLAGIGLIAGLLIFISSLASLVPAAMVGVLSISALIAEIAIVLAAFGALAKIPGLKSIIGEGGELLQEIGAAIGGFVGGIVGGVARGFTSQLKQIGSDLSEFMTNAKPFIDGAKKIDSSVMDGVKTIAETILILTAANVVDSLTSWFTGGSSITKFAEELVPFGKAMSDFSKELTGVDGELVANAAMAGKALAEMAATIPNSGGVLGFFAGENDMEVFGNQLVAFGTAMKSYSIAVSGMDTNAIINSTIAGKALTELANTIPNTGGLWGFFAGDNDMNAFGSQLLSFGSSMKSYSLAVSGLDVEAVTNSAIAGKALTELANTLPNTGGLIGFLTGDTDMNAFGMQLVSFGENFRKYSGYMEGVKPDVVVSTSNAAESLVKLSNTLPENKLFKNETWINDFGKQLREFGYYFLEYYNQIKLINASKLKSAIEAANDLIKMAKGMVDINTEGMSSFSKALTRLANKGIEEFIKAFDNSKERTTKAINQMIERLISSLKTNEPKLSTEFKNIIDNLVKALELKKDAFTTLGEDYISSLAVGMKNKSSSLNASAKEIVSSLVTTFENSVTNFRSAGSNAAEGFIAGMKSKSNKVINAGVEMAMNAYAATMTALDAHSPSLLFMEVGGYVASGFAQGIQNGTISVEKAVENMSKAAANEASKGASDINEAVEDELDVKGKIVEAFGIPDSLQKGAETVADKVKDIKGEISHALTGSLNETTLQKGLEKFADIFTRVQSKAKETASVMMDSLKNGATGSELSSVLSNTTNGITEENYEGFYNVGTELVQQIDYGITDKQNDINLTMVNLLNSLIKTIQQNYNVFRNAGSYTMHGFIVGMQSKENDIKAAARSMAIAAYNAAMAALNAHSPSRLFMEVGGYVVSGFAQGMENGIHTIKDSSTSMANTAFTAARDAISRISSAIDDGLDINPTIRPLLDLSDLESKTGRISTLLSDNKAMSISNSLSRRGTSEIQNGDVSDTPKQAASYNFVQNNYSPKALSRIEIYRQTKNQFSAIERTVKA